MFTRSVSFWFGCCAALALGSSATALEVTSDFTLDYSILDESDTVQVRGDAVLTIDLNGEGVRPILISHINLWDNASLVFLNGDLRGDVRVLGDNSIQFIGGRVGNRRVIGTGNAQITIDGLTQLDAVFEFSGGQQQIDVRGYAFNSAGLTVRNSPNAFVNVYSSNPYFAGGDPYFKLGGNNIPYVSQVGVAVGPPTKWLVHANDDRPVGDTNWDGVVDLADLNNVRNYFGGRYTEGSTLPLDGSIVDLEDLNRVRNTFGQSTPAPVPEPSTLAIGLLTLLLGQHAQIFKRPHARSGVAGDGA